MSVEIPKCCPRWCRQMYCFLLLAAQNPEISIYISEAGNGKYVGINVCCCLCVASAPILCGRTSAPRPPSSIPSSGKFFWEQNWVRNKYINESSFSNLKTLLQVQWFPLNFLFDRLKTLISAGCTNIEIKCFNTLLLPYTICHSNMQIRLKQVLIEKSFIIIIFYLRWLMFSVHVEPLFWLLWPSWMPFRRWQTWLRTPEVRQHQVCVC